MSRDLDLPAAISEEVLGLFLEDNDLDALTDILVQSLEEALRILRDEIRGDVLH
nr:hypothetical protein REQ54_03056 [Rhizobium sp. Q54]